MSTRLLIEASWLAAQQIVERNGALKSNAATLAGQYLQIAGGDAERARALIPEFSIKFHPAHRLFGDAREYLATVLAEERGATLEIVSAHGDRCGNSRLLEDGSRCPGCRACA